MNRLQWALETGSGSGWRQHYGYDAFGNRWVVDPAANPTLTYGIALSPRTPIGSTTTSNWFLQNNRLNLANSFDAVGNQIQYLPWSLTYDADNRQTSAQQVVNGTTIRHTYDYDGEGRRVRHQLQTGTGNGPWAVSSTTIFVYDASGRLAAEYSSTGTTPPCNTCYLTTDPLGSTRLITDETGTPRSRSDFLPFGEEVPADRTNRSTILCGASSCFGQATGVTQKFTSKERDTETGLDFFGARYLSSAQGRFTSADRPLLDQHPEIPQSWNLYAYTRNNPLNSVDPDGGVVFTVFGAVMGGVSGGVSAYFNNTDVRTGIASGALAGAAAGAVTDLTVATGGGALVVIGGAALSGAVGGAVGSAAGQYATGDGRIDGRQVAVDGITGAVFGAVLGTAGVVSQRANVAIQHFTNQVGASKIAASGNLRSKTYVTKTSQTTGKTPVQIEDVLDIESGKGQFVVSTQTTRGNLHVPSNGNRVPGGQNGGNGGAWQRQLKQRFRSILRK